MVNQEQWSAFMAAAGNGQVEDLQRAFDALYRLEVQDMVRFANYVVQNEHNAALVPGFVLDPEEVVEEGFVQLLKRNDNITNNPRHWLLGFIRHSLRHKVSKAWREEKSKHDAQRQLNIWQRNKKPKSTLSTEQRAAIREAVNSLPTRTRQVIVALFYRAESVATTAEKLGITENAVIQTKRRAFKKLERLISL